MQQSLSIYLTTSGQPIKAGVAAIEWNPNDFDYFGHDTTLTNILSSPLRDQNEALIAGKRMFLRFNQEGEYLFTPQADQPILFASVQLKAKQSYPTSTIQLATNNLAGDGKLQDLVVTFSDSTTVENLVDQTRTTQSSQTIVFTQPTTQPTASPLPTLTPTLSPTPTPTTQVCIPDSQRCQKRYIQECNPDGSDWLTTGVCTKGATCDPVTFSCKKEKKGKGGGKKPK